MKYKYFSLTIPIFLLSISVTFAQDKDDIAKAFYGRAEAKYSSGLYLDALRDLIEAENTLGSTNSKILYLKANALAQLYNLNETNKSYFVDLVKTVDKFFTLTDKTTYPQEKYIWMVNMSLEIKEEQKKENAKELEQQKIEKKYFAQWKEKNLPLSEGIESYMIDSRDGQKYKTISFSNGQTWMLENLRYTGADLSRQTVTQERDLPWFRGKYDSPKGNGDEVFYGAGDYNIGSHDKDEIKHICPIDWHIPNEEELDSLSAIKKTDALFSINMGFTYYYRTGVGGKTNITKGEGLIMRGSPGKLGENNLYYEDFIGGFRSPLPLISHNMGDFSIINFGTCRCVKIASEQ